MTRRNFIFSLLYLKVFLSSFFFSKNARASAPVDVKDIRQWSSKGYTRVAVDLSAPVEFSNKRISNPDRLYFDLKNTKISKEINTTLPVGDGILKTVRAGQFNQDTVRVVLDLEEIKDFKVFMLEDPARLIIDVYGHKKKNNTKDIVPALTTIVLDPGHGGHDPGAVGPNGLYEKDVVLDIALKLKKALSENQAFKVFMTRERDIFIPLEERTAFANSKHADLFISIHTNASPNKSARGIETYLLNWTNDEEAIRVAARENQISLKKMKEQMNKFKKSYVDVMLSSLERDLKRDKSLSLAGNIQKSVISVLSNKYDNIHDRHIKNALFYVLMGAEMSSVLAEVSFISNPVEEKLLKKEDYRDYIAKAMADGVNTYAAALSSVQKVAGLKKSAGAER